LTQLSKQQPSELRDDENPDLDDGEEEQETLENF
jgi:hypothetical protein